MAEFRNGISTATKYISSLSLYITVQLLWRKQGFGAYNFYANLPLETWWLNNIIKIILVLYKSQNINIPSQDNWPI